MELINIEEIKEIELAKVIKKVPIITDQVMATVFFIGSGKTLPRHTHEDIDEIHYIMDGNGEITVGDKTRSICTGMLILVPKGDSHFFSASKDGMALISFCPIIQHRNLNKTIVEEGE